MPNNLGELIEVQRKKLGLQQKQVAKMVGITNVSLCKVQTGERKLSKKKLKILADVLNVDYLKVLECADYDVELEIKVSKNHIFQTMDEEIMLLLDGLTSESEDTKILKEIMAILYRANKKDKESMEDMLKLLKAGVYNSK
ncbi:MAG: helix-turn-helix domain-containing protein [Clostridia bacterium]|nr:helix-turn-helix domain-containing protein [Clostridia bacterium]HJJ16281.1 helix-turn-helix domain-containing protein [Clostridiaceae bacterium]